MKEYIEINTSLCAGCGLCEETVPELFSMESNVVVWKKGAIPAELYDKASKIAEDCPSEAIKIKKCSSFSICSDSVKS